MPCTRSMRSKSKPSASGSNVPADEPKDPSPPPKTRPRTTRGKKLSKPELEPHIIEEVLPVTKAKASTRSTKTRPKAVTETVNLSTTESEPSSPPPKPKKGKSTRSTKQAEKTSKASKSSKARSTTVTNKYDEDSESVNSEVPSEVPGPSTATVSTAKSKSKQPNTVASTAKKAATAKAKGKKKLPEPSPETEVSDEELERSAPSTAKTLSLEQLQKHHAAPMKTALAACSDISECLGKIMATGSLESELEIIKALDHQKEKEQERAFEVLLKAGAMPPPLTVPKAKRGRPAKKRARSRTPPPPETEVPQIPQSFNFAEKVSAKSKVPANKKIIMDLPTPDKDAKNIEDEIKENDKEVEAAATASTSSTDNKPLKKKKGNKRNAKAIIESDSETEKKEKAKKPKRKPKQKHVADEDDISTEHSDVGGDGKKEKPVPLKVPEKEKTKKPVKDLKENPVVVDDKLVTSKTVTTPSPPPPKHQNNEAMDVDNMFEDSIIEIPPEEIEKVAPKQKEAVVATPTIPAFEEKTSADSKKAESAPAKSTVGADNRQLDGTFVVRTPKEDQNVKNTVLLNAAYTPELFDSPKSESITNEENASEKVKEEDSNTASSSSKPVVETPKSESSKDKDCNSNGSSSNGIVASLVNLFSKGTAVVTGASNVEGGQESRSKSPELPSVPSTNAVLPPPQPKKDFNSTFTVSAVKKDKINLPSASAMNVTVTKVAYPHPLELELTDDEDDVIPEKKNGLVPILPPQSMQPFAAKSNVPQESAPAALNRTFDKEPTANLDVVEEEDESGTAPVAAAGSEKNGNKTKPPIPLNKLPGTEKEAKKNHSNSSSSSTSSLKSASSNPSIASSTGSKKVVGSKGSVYGSTGKLHDVYKSKPLEEAEKRRQEFLQQKVDNSKKKLKLEEWKKKVEQKAKMEEKIKEKQKFTQPIPASSSSGIVKKSAMLAGPSSGFLKPKNIGPIAGKFQGAGNLFPPLPLSKNPFHIKTAPTPTPIVQAPTGAVGQDAEMDETFKTAASSLENRSFLDVTGDGNLSSYDITMYEDLDEEMNYRKNKTLPKWASDKESLKVALYSMVLFQDYYNKGSLPTGFPKPDKFFKLFPSKPGLPE